MLRFRVHAPDGRTFEKEIDADVFTVGRLPDAGLRLRFRGISREHISIERGSSGYRFRDLGSTNGTFHNNLRMPAAPLSVGDELRLGECRLEVVADSTASELPTMSDSSPVEADWEEEDTKLLGVAVEDEDGREHDSHARDDLAGAAALTPALGVVAESMAASAALPVGLDAAVAAAVHAAVDATPDVAASVDATSNEADDAEPELVVAAPTWVREAPFWALSALLHLALFVVLMQVVFTRTVKKDGSVSMRLETIRQLEDYDPTPERTFERQVKIPDPREIEDPVVERRLDELVPEKARGVDLDKLTNIDLESFSVHDAIGLGSGAAGLYGERWEKGSLVREGGSVATEEAVRAALEWLVRHQSPDGSWKAKGFIKSCQNPKRPCRNEKSLQGAGLGAPEYDVGVTGLAMLAFAGYGQTHISGDPRYVDALKKAVNYLRGVQVRSSDERTNGRYGGLGGHWVYNHAIATLAMAEILVMSRDVLGLRRSVEDAVALIFRMQNPRSAWRYGVRDGQNDVSVTGWMLLALKTARSANLRFSSSEFKRSFAAALAFIRGATTSGGITGYTKQGDPRGGMPTMTAVGVLSRIFGGERRSEMINKGVGVCLRNAPEWRSERRDSVDLYYWYYGSYAIFQHGGRSWRIWNGAMQQALLPTQRRGGDEDGSWDPIGPWGQRGGRVYSTALGAMTLEVYYRFQRVRGEL